jgi:hypothetical protein
MDPTAALRELLIALDEHDRNQALEHVTALVTWLGKGGALPDARRAVYEFKRTQDGPVGEV